MKPTLLTFSMLILASLSTAQAATFTVTRMDDPAPDACTATDCSLREAVLAAELTAAADSVVLGTGTYVLTRVAPEGSEFTGTAGPLWVVTPLTITGAGATRTRIRWDAITPHGHSVIRFGNAVGSTQMTISAVTLSHGRGTSGGCIYASSPRGAANLLVLDRTTLELCETFYGGGVSLWFTNLSLRGARIRDNVASHHGGGIWIWGDADIDSQKSVISGNSAGSFGGAVALDGEPMYQFYTNVIWADDGSSVVRDNHAGQIGGAISLWNASTLDLSTIDSAPAGQLMTISNNTSAGTGGAIYLGNFGVQAGGINRLRRLRINDNEAVGDGGAVHAEGALHIADVEMARNRTTTGVGGGIALYGANLFDRVVERVSLRDNVAVNGGGGAIAAGCQAFEVSNSAIFGNQAGAGRGQAIETVGAATLRHVTVSDNVSSSVGSPALRKLHDSLCGNTQMRYANSLIVDACRSTVASQMLSDGGNQFGPAAAACPTLSQYDRRQSVASVFRLSIDTFGGDFEVLGWPNDLVTRPQRNFGRQAFCTPDDIRGALRVDGRCDAGAFEQ